MKGKRALPRLAPAQESLGLPTIMDRALAAAHGSRYVHLAVFAIDIDRVYWLDPEGTDLPFGWEVFLTECFLLGSIDASLPDGRDLIDAACSFIMEETPGEPPIGGQLVFAVWDAVRRGALPAELSGLFSQWRTPPARLLRSLSALWKSSGPSMVLLAGHCLQAELSPKLAEPTRQTLLSMQDGTFAVPTAPAPPAPLA